MGNQNPYTNRNFLETRRAALQNAVAANRERMQKDRWNMTPTDREKFDLAITRQQNEIDMIGRLLAKLEN